MSVNYIQQDLNTITIYQQTSAATIAPLFAVAQNTLALANQLYNNSQMTTAYNYVSSFVQGVCDYYTATNVISAKSHSEYTVSLDNAIHFNDKNSYFGNLIHVQIRNSFNTLIYTSSQLQTQNFTLSAPPGHTWSDGTTLSASSSASYVFFAGQFAFVCQYLWATPIQGLWLDSSNNAASLYNPKQGLYYSANTLMHSICSIVADSAFFDQKQIYLSNML